MNVLLVRPPRPKKSITLGEFMYCEPLGLEVVYTLIKDICRVTLFDMMADNRPLTEVLAQTRPVFVGFTTLCIDVENTLRLCRETKAFDPRIVTAVGGTQTFFNPEAFFNGHVDHIFKVTDEKNIRALIRHMKRGADVPALGGVLSRSHAYKEISGPKRNFYTPPDIACTHKYRKNYSYLGYRPCAILQTSVGCGGKCLFCMRWVLEGGQERPFDLKGVIDHIRRLPEHHIMIIDNDFFNDGARLAALCDLLEKNRIHKNFICYASVSGVIENEAQMARLKQNGIKTVLVGYETFSETELAFYRKQTPRQSSLKAAAILKRYGIDCWASFIIHPDWTSKDFKRFRKFVKRLNPEISTISPLTPFPGLALHTVFKDRLLLSEQDYEKWSFGQVSVRPSKMGLRQYYFEIIKTLLFMNLVVNDTRYMVDRFGFKTLLRITKGSVKVLFRYIMNLS